MFRNVPCFVDGLVVPTFESADTILKYEHANESYQAVLSCGVV